MKNKAVLSNNTLSNIQGTLAANSLTRWTGTELDFEPSQIFSIEVPANEVIQTLIRGNQEFVAKKNYPLQRQKNQSLSGVAQGRNPIAAIINSADLCDSIEEIFNQKFGDLFTIHNHGNLLTNKEISSLEYSILMEGVSLIIVLVNGHSTDIAEAFKGVSVFSQIDRLKSSPLIKKLTLTQEIKIVTGYYDLDTGHISIVKK